MSVKGGIVGAGGGKVGGHDHLMRLINHGLGVVAVVEAAIGAVFMIRPTGRVMFTGGRGGG